MITGQESGRGADGEPTLLRYPMASICGDYLRAGLGLVLSLGPLLLLDVAGPLVVLLGVLGALFAWFGMRTVSRHLSRVELSGQAIALRGPVSRHLAWGDLDRMKLAYYAPRRARDDGWLQLTLRGGGGGSIRLDSTLTGFDQVLGQASRAARQKALPLDAATHANLAALGLDDSREADGAPPVTRPERPGAAATPSASRARW